MGKLKNLEYSKLDSVGHDILRAIDMAYHWFIQENPKIESVCDEKTMTDWYNFLAFSYCKIKGDLLEYVLDDFKEESDDFDFEISPLMEKADSCAGVAWEKYDIDHQNDALDCLREDPELYSGDEGYDADEDPDGLHYEILDEAYETIYDSVDTSNFKKLSMISF
tara:strand:- start:1240 stop:1734 length:495 start_codon:yes stop_codon:yes gene_type:complete